MIESCCSCCWCSPKPYSSKPPNPMTPNPETLTAVGPQAPKAPEASTLCCASLRSSKGTEVAALASHGKTDVVPVFFFWAGGCQIL